jgi:hypothetical protein
MLSMNASAMAEDMPGPDGDALWKYISKVSPYTKWSFWSNHEGMRDGRAPHGSQHKVFVNKQAFGSIAAPLQYGTIEVKEKYSKN